MKMKKVIACLLASLGLNTACAQASYENADVKGFAVLMNDPNVVVLDVRSAEEFKEGHIEGAVNIDQAQNNFIVKAKATIPIDKTIAVYCRSGKDQEWKDGEVSRLGACQYPHRI